MKIWVIKIGTSILRGTVNISTEEVIETLCKSFTSFLSEGNKIVLVTSGAVGLGCKKLNFKTRPHELSTLQATAAVGQVNLMTLYDINFKKYGHNVAQILITKADFNSREAFNNASKTFKNLIELNVIPIDPRKNKDAYPIKEVQNNELKEIKNKNTKAINNKWGTGGIETKLLAAEIATKGGVEVQLVDGRNKNNLINIFKNKKIGTLFHPVEKPIGNKKSWLSHAIQTVGKITLDEV